MPFEMNQVDQDDDRSLESKGTDTKQGSENRPEELASNNLPSEIKMTIINVNNESDLENAIDNVVGPYNIPYDISAIPVSSWDELQQLMTGKTMKFNTKSEKTRAENWFSPSDENLGSSDEIKVSDSLMSALLQGQPPVENNDTVESTNDESTNEESTNDKSLPVDDVKDQETSYETTSELPGSPAKFDDYLKLAVQDAIKSALPEVMNKLFVDIARDFVRRHAENELVLKSESLSV